MIRQKNTSEGKRKSQTIPYLLVNTIESRQQSRTSHAWSAESHAPHTHTVFPAVYSFHGGSRQLLRQLPSCSIATTSITSANRPSPYAAAWSGFQPRQLCYLWVLPDSRSSHSTNNSPSETQFPFGNTAQELAGRGANVHHAAKAAQHLYFGLFTRQSRAQGILHMERPGGMLRYISGLSIKALAVRPKNKPFNNYKDRLPERELFSLKERTLPPVSSTCQVHAVAYGHTKGNSTLLNKARCMYIPLCLCYHLQQPPPITFISSLSF